MRKESLIDVKVFVGLYQELLRRYERISERVDLDSDAFDFVGENSYLSRFIQAQNTIGDYDRRPFIDNAIPVLCKFEQLVVDAERR